MHRSSTNFCGKRDQVSYYYLGAQVVKEISDPFDNEDHKKSYDEGHYLSLIFVEGSSPHTYITDQLSIISFHV